MRRYFGLAFVLLQGLIPARAQQTISLVQVGWATVVDQYPVESSGYRFAAAWEFMPTKERWTLGFALGICNLSGTRASVGGTRSFKFSSVPFGPVTRVIFGGERLNVFVRVGMGAHFSTVMYDDLVATKESKWGMSALTSAGLMYWISKKIFLGTDYEWLWLSNTHPNLGSVGIVSVSSGLKL